MAKFQTRTIHVEHYTFEISKKGRTFNMTLDGYAFDNYTKISNATKDVDSFRAEVMAEVERFEAGREGRWAKH